MPLSFKNYSNEVMYGATIQSSDISNATILGSNIALATVGGNNLTTKFNYATIAVGTTGPTKVNLFGQSTAPVAGTITGFWCVVQNSTGTHPQTTAGTFTLATTTGGSVATIAVTGTAALLAGYSLGTGVLSSAFASGDSAFIQGVGTGTCTAFVTLQVNT